MEYYVLLHVAVFVWVYKVDTSLFIGFALRLACRFATSRNSPAVFWQHLSQCAEPFRIQITSLGAPWLQTFSVFVLKINTFMDLFDAEFRGNYSHLFLTVIIIWLVWWIRYRALTNTALALGNFKYEQWLDEFFWLYCSKYYLLALLEVLLKGCAEFLRVLNKLFFALLDSLFARCARNEAHHLVDGVQQLLDGTCDFPKLRNGSDFDQHNKFEYIFETPTWWFPKTFCDLWSRPECDWVFASAMPTFCSAPGRHPRSDWDDIRLLWKHTKDVAWEF